MAESTRMLLGLGIGIITMIILVAKTKVHSFIAMLLAALITGIIGGMPIVSVKAADGHTIVGVINAISSGFGNTLASTGIIIGLGVMMGAVLEKSGAAERLAVSFIKLVGKGNEEWALGVTGWVVSIPVFADSAVVMLCPLCKAISKVTGKSVIGLGLSLACGLQLTHSLVPPTPGPLAAAGMLNVDVGQMIAGGALLSIPMLLIIIPYCKWIGKKIYQVVNEDDEYVRPSDPTQFRQASTELLDKFLNRTDLPGLAISAAPIVIPILLILMKTVLDLVGIPKDASYYPLIALLGSPIVALMIGTLIAIYGLVPDRDTKEVLNIMNDGIKDTGIIMLITGVGGSLGYVVRMSGIGNILGSMVVAMPIPAVLIPFCIAALMRIVLGSATVAIVTAASLTMPLMGQLTISPLLMSLSCCVGAISFGYFTDSGFWVWNGLFGVSDLKEQLSCKTAVSLIMAFFGLFELLVAQYFI
ncbi:GntP family permease [Acidaminococcus sp. NSJ-142]|jgi:GntP family gluconate:H+ symporter|uniref:GntP family permease n=1 Tax=Acidaminococcus TaxID=904 RepID=UPI000CFA23DD|nr:MULTISPECIES: SLC13 family permease [Acidaminococcus]MCD2436472.1 GntP family permease [Acidaminococcus hominis]RHK02642.1 GntP family permease [Acidaminococcus sp. AM05-11]